MSISDEILAKILEDNQLLTGDEVKVALGHAKSKKISLYEALLDRDLVSDENIGRITADYFHVPFVALAKTSIDQKALRILPEEVAKKQQLLPFAQDENGLKVAVVDPENFEPVNFLAQKTGRKINIYLATARDLAAALSLYKSNLQETFDRLLKEKVPEFNGQVLAEAPITKMVDVLIEYSYASRASDVHIEPEKEQSVVRFRIDGVLHDVLTIPKAVHNQIVARVKVASKLKTDEHLSAQDGKMEVNLPEEDLDIRVSVVPITHGEKVVLRLLAEKSRQFGLSDLGLSDRDLGKIKEGFNRPYGMILATGPTGSGKTTTIYSILKLINSRDRNIATVEDPVEYDIEGVNQIQVNAKTNLTFANGLRAILRQDPNIIFVGEIRDAETAEIAVNSATTGHLVLSTLHTNDAATAIPRLLDMGTEPFLIASTVNVIIAQRLVRKICDKCRFSVEIQNSKFRVQSQLSPQLVKKYFPSEIVRLYQGKGCPVCQGTGYVGRVGIFEVLQSSKEVKELINSKADSGLIAALAVKQGMTTMLEDGLAKVRQGVTTVEEIMRATKE